MLPQATGYSWNATAHRYIDNETGRFVPQSEIRNALENLIDQSGLNMNAVTQSLIDGNISLAGWQTEMMRQIKLTHTASAALAQGGFAQMTSVEWGATGQLIREQYAYLRNFAKEIADGTQPLDGRMLVRADLYADASNGTFWEIDKRSHLQDGYDLGRRVLESGADHCFVAGTMIETANGKKPIEDIKQGEIVVTRFGKRRVVKTYKHWVNNDRLYLVIAGNKKVVTTGNHPFYTREGWRNVEDLRRTDNIMLYQNGSNRFFAHVAFPYSFNSITAFCKVGVSRFISRLLFNLPLVQWIKARVSVPVIAISLYNKISNFYVNNKTRFNYNLAFVGNTEIVKNTPKLYFEFARFVSLIFSTRQKKHGKTFGSTGILPQIFSRAGTFGRIISSHVFRSRIMNQYSFSRFIQCDPQFIGFVSHDIFSKPKFSGNPLGAVLRVIGSQKINFVFMPQWGTSIFAGATSTFLRNKIFSPPAMADITPIWVKGFPATVSAYIRLALSYLSAFGTSSFFWSFIGHYLLSHSDMRTPKYTTFQQVYNIEVEGVHEYIANGFIVHNCDDCLEYASEGWMPIDDIPEIGNSQCLTRCRCEIEYMKSSEAE